MIRSTHPESRRADLTMSHRANEVESSGITHRLHPTETLGHVRLQDEVTGATILVPQPSSDPNDPLNW
jgi:hypothetical protein